MLSLAQPQHTDTQQRPLIQIEAMLCFVSCQPPDCILPLGLGQRVEVFHHQGHMQGGTDSLYEPTMHGRKVRA